MITIDWIDVNLHAVFIVIVNFSVAVISDQAFILFVILLFKSLVNPVVVVLISIPNTIATLLIIY